MTSEVQAAFPISASALGAALSITVAPHASRTAIERLADGTIRVRLTAPPVEGAANVALLRYLAKTLNVSRSRLSIASGATGRRKRIAVEGMDAEELRARLETALIART